MARASRVNTPDRTPDRTPPHHGLRWLWLAGLVLVLDQISKLVILAKFSPYQDVLPVTAFFKLVHWRNTGAAFSFLADQGGWQRAFFIVLALAASAVIVHLLRQTQGSSLFRAALALILGGALGNVIDRAAYGHVVDFLLFYWQDWFFPAFNLADSAITLGAGLLIFDSLKGQHT